MTERSEYTSETGLLMLSLLNGFYWFDEGLQNYLRACGWPAVSRPQSMVMASIISGHVSPSDIARRLGISRQAVHTTLKSMIAINMISLVDDPKSGRSKIVQLTETGAAMRQDAQQALKILSEALIERIGERAVKILKDQLSQEWGAPLTFSEEDTKNYR